MKISTDWLKEFVKLPKGAEDLAQRLGDAGIEVAGVSAAVPSFTKVVVSQVKSVAPHPSADKLKVCQADTGKGGLSQIVCGAPNVREGMKAPVVLPGGKLPDGTLIQATKLRGVDSAGMLCSARELGLSEDAAGLMALPDDAPLGKDLHDYLGGGDHLIEIEITPNRGDCLSILGVAREASVYYKQPLKTPKAVKVKAAIKDILPVEVKASAACPVFAGRVIKGLKPGATTPLWMRERLRRAGLRSINAAADVTQYVMLELGQPMHAYDLKRISGGIVVRMAKVGESVRLLDGNIHKLDPDMLAIADHQRVLGLGGIMGGMESSVQADTTDVYLEAAFFSPVVVSGRAQRLKLQTDAGYRFERGVDLEGQARAIERATQLLLEIAGGRPGPLKVHGDASKKPKAKPIRLRRARIESLLGMAVLPKETGRILKALGFALRAGKDGWTVTAPSHRFDVEMEEDLIEEVGRIHGYGHIPSLHYPSRQGLEYLPEERVDLRRLRQCLVERGYQEAITYSFVDAALQRRIYGASGIPLANPITAEMTEMRLGLWPGLLKVLEYNLNRQQGRVKLFETGLRFILQHNEIKQVNTVAGLVFGPQFPLQWGVPERASDLADLRADVEALAGLGGSQKPLEARPASHPALHPGQSASLSFGGRDLGWMGAIHPQLAQGLDLPQGVYLFELALEPLLEAKIPVFQPVSRFPHIRRDLAVVVKEEVSAQALLDHAREAAGSVLQEVRIFDIYRGNGIDSGRKSVALGLILQDSSRTLTDEEADLAITRVADRLRRVLGATIRD